jgi:hypothetical protein
MPILTQAEKIIRADSSGPTETFRTVADLRPGDFTKQESAKTDGRKAAIVAVPRGYGFAEL